MSRATRAWTSDVLDAVYDAERRAAAAGRLRVRVLDGEAAARDVVDEVDFGALQVARADRIDEQLDAVRLDDGVGRRVPFALVDHQAVLEAGAAAALHEHAQARVDLVLFGQQLGDLRRRRRSDINHVMVLQSERLFQLYALKGVCLQPIVEPLPTRPCPKFTALQRLRR